MADVYFTAAQTDNLITIVPDTGSIPSIPISLGLSKGDIAVFNGSAWVRLPVGANGYVLVADSTTATGLGWALNTSSGGSSPASGTYPSTYTSTY